MIYLWEGTIVPEVTLVREAIANESKLSLLSVLLDGIESFLFGDLFPRLAGAALTQW